MAQFPDAFKFITSHALHQRGDALGITTPAPRAGKVRTNAGSTMCAQTAPRASRGARRRARRPRADRGDGEPRFASTASGRSRCRRKTPTRSSASRSPSSSTPSPASSTRDAAIRYPTHRTAQSNERACRAPAIPKIRPLYVAAMDPAFRHDKFAFTIMHHSMDEGIVQDYFEEWTPSWGFRSIPKTSWREIKLVLDRYGVSSSTRTNTSSNPSSSSRSTMGFTIVGIDFTSSSKARIYGSFASAGESAPHQAPRQAGHLRPARALEKKRTPNGAVQIAAPPGKFDDAAAACGVRLKDSFEHPAWNDSHA
jgi:hypothetical protein